MCGPVGDCRFNLKVGAVFESGCRAIRVSFDREAFFRSSGRVCMGRASPFVASCCVPAGFAPMEPAESEAKKEESVDPKVASGAGCASGASAWAILIVDSTRYQHLR